MGHEGYNILLRSGYNIGRSIELLHYHIIPTIEVCTVNNDSNERKIMTEEEINEFLEDFKKAELEIA